MKEDLWLPLRFSETKFDTEPIIVDSTNLVPFQFRTLNASTGSVSVYLVDEDDNETLITPTIHIYTIGSYTYYTFSDTQSVTAGIYYYLKIVDGSYTYYSVPFRACALEPIVETGHSKKWDMWLPMKFAEAPMNYIPIHVDSTHLIPFQFRTANTSTGTVTAYLVTKAGVETAITMDIKIYQIGNWTYYLFNGTVSTIPSGIYYLKLVDGTYTYYSVLFDVCNYETTVPVATVKYGYLYNWYAATDARNICSEGWHIPTGSELLTLQTYLGGENGSGGKLKEIGTIYWTTPNTGATNEMGFNFRGAGFRSYWDGGIFSDIQDWGKLWSTTDDEGWANTLEIVFSEDDLYVNEDDERNGFSLRPFKDSTALTHGQTGTYTDPSGITYPTICIGTQEIVSCNIITKHYRNGDAIPEVTDDTAWTELTTGARCSYDNDETNAFS